jgi:hypothetical protein
LGNTPGGSGLVDVQEIAGDDIMTENFSFLMLDFEPSSR